MNLIGRETKKLWIPDRAISKWAFYPLRNVFFTVPFLIENCFQNVNGGGGGALVRGGRGWGGGGGYVSQTVS